MADQRKDPQVAVKSFSIAPSGAKMLDRVTTGIKVSGASEVLTLPKFVMTLRFNEEDSKILIKGIADAVADSPKNGTTLAFHFGGRETNDGSRTFNAAFGFIKPLQLAPNEAAPPTNNALANAVGGKTDFAPVTDAADFKAIGTK